MLLPGLGLLDLGVEGELAVLIPVLNRSTLPSEWTKAISGPELAGLRLSSGGMDYKLNNIFITHLDEI